MSKGTIIHTVRFSRWLGYYTTPESQTFLNATQSAICAYSYDPVRQYNLACVVGSRNIRKYKFLLTIEAASQGITLPVLLQKMYEAACKEGYYSLERFLALLYFPETPLGDIKRIHRFQ